MKIGLAGFGTVGGGTFAVLERNRNEIERRAGSPIEVKTVVCRNLERARASGWGAVNVCGDWHAIVDDPEIEIAVEVMGGIEPAKSYILAAIQAGKHVVTANKALLALHGNENLAAAEKKGVIVGFEASVAGGVHIDRRPCARRLRPIVSSMLPALSTAQVILFFPPCVRRGPL